jgi:hypothetical protein
MRIAVTLFIMTALTTGICIADSSYSDNTVHPYATVSIPVRHVIKGETIEEYDSVFVLETETDDTPMPEDSDGRIKTVRTSDEDVEFGSIDYYRPGLYNYTISRQGSSKGRVKQDDSEYSVLLAVYNDGGYSIAAWKTGTDKEEGKAEEIIYEDTMRPSPKTGDSGSRTMIITLTALIIVCIAALGAMIRNRRKEMK